MIRKLFYITQFARYCSVIKNLYLLLIQLLKRKLCFTTEIVIELFDSLLHLYDKSNETVYILIFVKMLIKMHMNRTVQEFNL